MNLVLPFERQMALAVGCLPLQQQPPPSVPLSPLLLHVCHLPLSPLLPFLVQGIFMNACRKNAYLSSTLFRASPIYTLPLAALLRMCVCVCAHTSVYICISWLIYMPTISGRIPLTSETSNSFCAQTCKLVLCHLRVLHSKWQLQHVLSPSIPLSMALPFFYNQPTSESRLE